MSWARAWLGARLTLIAVLAPVTLIALGFAGYGWWWRTVADQVREQITLVQAAQRALGRDLTWDKFTIGGFPTRVEANLSTLRFVAPDQGSTWDGDQVVVRVQPLSLGRVSVSFEGQQRYFTIRDRLFETEAHAEKALFTLADAGSQTARLKVDIVGLAGHAKLDDTDVKFVVDSASGGVRLTAPVEKKDGLPHVDAVARLENVALQGPVNLPLGRTIQLIEIDAGLEMPAKLTEVSFAGLLAAWRQTETPLELRQLTLDWGGVTIAAKGSLTLDAHAMPEGSVRLTLGNHPRIMELLEAYGWIDAEARAKATKVLDMLAFLSGDKQRRVTVPLRIAQGAVYVGPVKVASLLPAPTAAVQMAPDETAAP